MRLTSEQMQAYALTSTLDNACAKKRLQFLVRLHVDFCTSSVMKRDADSEV